MPRYFFDIHAGSLSEWDDDGTAAVGPDGAIAHAKNILAIVVADLDRASGDHSAVVVIRDGAGHQIATLTGAGSGEPRNHSARTRLAGLAAVEDRDMTTTLPGNRPAMETAALIERTRRQAEMIRAEVAQSHRLVGEALALLRTFPAPKPRGE